MDICSSPPLIAAYHVFLRLLVPRHPPCALCSLTINLDDTLTMFPSATFIKIGSLVNVYLPMLPIHSVVSSAFVCFRGCLHKIVSCKNIVWMSDESYLYDFIS